MTTLGIGGPGRYFIHATSENTVLEAVGFANDKNLPIFVLGGGSNLLVADGGFQGLVLRIGIRGVEWEPAGDRTLVHAGAGEEWDGLVAACVDRGLAGLECLSGIPGYVGGTPVQNVGAYGQEVSEVLTSVRAYDRRSGSVVVLAPAECGFSYRSSIFNTIARGRYIVLGVTYALYKDAPPAIRYADLRRAFEGRKDVPRLSEVREAVCRIRAGKAMLLVEGDPDCRSAGSFFKNPTLSAAEFDALQALVANDSIPRYPVLGGQIKTSAAWLIEHAGFKKGYAIGPAGLSTRHTLALVNKGNATAADIVRLARVIRNGVLDRFGVKLTPEPVFIGFDQGLMSEFFGNASLLQ